MQIDASFYENLIVDTVATMLRTCTADPVTARNIAMALAPEILVEIESTQRSRMVYMVEPLLDEAQERVGREDADTQLSTATAAEIVAVLQDAGHPDLS